ncbi:MAG TPA: hypothetical protein VGB13_12570 [Candidatus Krumholzibacteria bacterium]
MTLGAATAVTAALAVRAIKGKVTEIIDATIEPRWRLLEMHAEVRAP